MGDFSVVIAAYSETVPLPLLLTWPDDKAQAVMSRACYLMSAVSIVDRLP